MINVLGRTRVEAVERATILKSALSGILPDDCTLWAPTYQGFDPEERRHYAALTVTLGSDKQACREILEKQFG